MYVYNISFAFFHNILHTKKVQEMHLNCSTAQTRPIQPKFKFLFHWKEPILGLYYKDFG